jgi:hypothetical protein
VVRRMRLVKIMCKVAVHAPSQATHAAGRAAVRTAGVPGPRPGTPRASRPYQAPPSRTVAAQRPEEEHQAKAFTPCDKLQWADIYLPH